MFDVTDIIRMRQRRRATNQRGPAGRMRRFVLGFTLLVSLLLALAAIALALAYTQLTQDLPPLETLPVLLDPSEGMLLEPTRFYDRTGQHVILTLENPAARGHTYLRGELPETLVQATLAVADPDFWTHSGYSLSNLTNPEAFTLAENLAFDLLLWQEPPGLRRTLRARLLAGQMTARYGREQILEWYLNSADYGQLAYGTDAAARVYFGKSARELALPEAVLLAVVAQAPDLNPVDTPELAIERQQKALAALTAQNALTPEEAAAAAETSLAFSTARPISATETTLFTNLVFEQLAPAIDRDRLQRGGLKVITTLDYDLQTQAACALETQFARLYSRPAPPAAACETARLLPALPAGDDNFSPDLAANVAAIDPRSGQILALVGTDAVGQPPAQLTGHPPGSLLAPYVYLAAFTRGFSPASLVWDIPANLPPAVSGVPNADGQYHGPMRMRTALANDYLIPALQVLSQMGAENVWRTTRQLGLPSLSAPAGTAAQRLLLDGGEITLLEAVHAYGVFSTQGVWIGQVQPGADNAAALGGSTGSPAPMHPLALLQVVDTAGNVWVAFAPPQSRPVTSAQLAYLTTHILSDEAARWPSLGHPNPLEIGRPAAVKLGTTEDNAHAWTVGFTPQLAVGVWVGDENAEAGTAPGAGDTGSPLLAAGVWHALMQYAGRSLAPETWPVPPGISHIDVCDPSGMLPTVYCPTTVTEVFLPGSEPTQYDTLFRAFQINRETGLLATVFTPPTLIDERVYMAIPPEAAAWAQAAGLSIPPEGYDLVAAPPATLPGVRFTLPEMFANVRGVVTIQGSAFGDDFRSYRVQVGQGLNPQQWVQLGDESATPVEAGALAAWDTTGLTGLYAIRLLVVMADQRVETTIIQVTVDNQLPEVGILSPAEGQIFTYPGDRAATFQFSASDDLGLARVEVYLNDSLLTTFTQPPYAMPWDIVRPGSYTLRARAIDLAGNEVETVIEFEIER